MNSRLQLYPLPRIGVALVLGIVFGDFFHAYLPTFLWLLCTLVGLLVYFLSRRKPLLQSGVLLGCVFLFGSWLVNLRENRLEFIDTQKEITFQGVVISKPIIRGKVAMFDMLVVDNYHPIKIQTSMMWDSTRKKHLLPEIGSGLLVQSRIKPFVQKDSLSNFNVIRWAQVQGYRGQTFVDDEKWQYSVVSLSTLSLLQRARLRAMKWRNLLVKSFPIEADDSSNIAIVAAMTLGDKSGLSQTTKQLFSITGSSHVLALSGLHLGILYTILMLAFSRRKKRIWAQMIVILAIWTYHAQFYAGDAYMTDAVGYSENVLGYEKKSEGRKYCEYNGQNCGWATSTLNNYCTPFVYGSYATNGGSHSKNTWNILIYRCSRLIQDKDVKFGPDGKPLNNIFDNNSWLSKLIGDRQA